MQGLIDIGANLAHDSFEQDRDAAIQRAFAAGVQQIVVTGSSLQSTHDAIGLARRFPGRLFATAGMHPHHASDWNASVAHEISRAARESWVVAIGECGLDYYRDLAPRPAQRAAFEAQLGLACSVNKPVFLHQRDAHDDFLAVLEAAGAPLRGVAHCFTGDYAQLRAYLDLGLHIGITGWICDERRGSHLVSLMREIPAERLLIETDAPYLLPRDLRPQPPTRRNEPQWLPHIAARIAAARGETLAMLSASSTRAAQLLFGLPPAEAWEGST